MDMTSKKPSASDAAAISAMPTVTGGYSRRSLPGDPKSTDRRRLLADRDAYISYLESHVERTKTAALEAETASTGVKQLRACFEDLEERMRSTNRAVELVQTQSSQISEAARVGRQENLDQVNNLEGRTLRLEQIIAENRITSEAEISRLRNEVSLAVQELGQRLDDRVKTLRERIDERVNALQAITDDATSQVIREAQATCIRLADDALGVAEASQKKVDELAQQAASSQRRLEDVIGQTEQGLEALRAEVVAVRAELAGAAACAASGTSRFGEAASAPDVMAPAVDDAVNSASNKALADAVERRLAARMSQQVLQLSDVLRRVVQSQAALNQQFGVGGRQCASSLSQSVQASAKAAEAAELGPDLLGPSRGHDRRQFAVEELYRELRQLESNGLGMRSKRG